MMKPFLVMTTALLLLSPAAAPAAALPPFEITGTADTVLFTRNGTSSRFPALGPDGTWVAWYSDASDIVPGDGNGQVDVFARDIRGGITFCVSISEDGIPAGVGEDISLPRGLSVSSGGEFIAFTAYGSPGRPEVFVRDMKMKKNVKVSPGNPEDPSNGPSLNPSLSKDGRFVAFESSASDHAGDHKAPFSNIFVRDMQSGEVELISAGSGGEAADGDSFSPSISWDGRMVVFSSRASNLVPGQVTTGTSVFAFDRAKGETTLVSASRNGQGANGDSHTLPSSISGDGRSVLFLSAATDLAASDVSMTDNLFIRDLWTGAVFMVSLGDEIIGSSLGALSGALDFDGRNVVFASDSDHLARGDINRGTDIFVRNLQTRKVHPVSISGEGNPVFSESSDPAMSGRGGIVAFSARPLDLLTGEGKECWEVFVFDMSKRKILWISTPARGF
jgi:Tol biopolymer transport system component